MPDYGLNSIMGHKTAVFRKEHFNAAHRLHVEEWSAEKNAELFGKCNLPHYHGHNYELVVKVVGYPDPVSGYLIDMKVLSELVQREVLEHFDHKNLNLDVPFFKNVNPTAENIAVVIFNLLRPHIPAEIDLQVRLYETERNFVEYPANI